MIERVEIDGNRAIITLGEGREWYAEYLKTHHDMTLAEWIEGELSRLYEEDCIREDMSIRHMINSGSHVQPDGNNDSDKSNID